MAFFDVTFSVQKSVTLLHTAFEAAGGRRPRRGRRGDRRRRGRRSAQAVEDAIWAGNNAGARPTWPSTPATPGSGTTAAPAGRYVDAHDWVVASFFQHDSRDHDPQLHIHNAMLNRVEGPDGVWRTLDWRGLLPVARRPRPRSAERTTEERLTHALGVLVATRPDGKAREVVGVAAGGDGPDLARGAAR